MAELDSTKEYWKLMPLNVKWRGSLEGGMMALANAMVALLGEINIDFQYRTELCKMFTQCLSHVDPTNNEVLRALRLAVNQESAS